MTFDITPVRPWERDWIDAEEWHLVKDVQYEFKYGVNESKEAQRAKAGANAAAKALPPG